MKYIKKESEPEKLRSWFNRQLDESGNRLGCDYRDDLPSDVKRSLHEHLLVEQGFLCCYTGILIDIDISHVEHLKPYKQCKEERNYEDVNYLNLMAAYPGTPYEENINGQKYKKCPFGAHAKGHWFQIEELVSPLDENCELRFSFDDAGGIQSANNGDNAAQTTIQKLVLDHPRLIDLRRAAIDEALFPDDIELDEAELQSIADGMYAVKGQDGKFPKFCFVVEQVARQLVGTA